jgi:hypothetical protein
MENLFTNLRVFLIVSSISVWHSFANEKMSSGTLEVGSCRLFKSDVFLILLLVHFLMVCISFGFLKRRLNLYFATINILFGAFIVMSIKPPTWYLSFEWQDCYSLYNSNNGISKLAMLSYVLITAGAIELIELFSETTDVIQIFRCFEKRRGLAFSWRDSVILASIGAGFFGICWLMCYLALD